MHEYRLFSLKSISNVRVLLSPSYDDVSSPLAIQDIILVSTIKCFVKIFSWAQFHWKMIT